MTFIVILIALLIERFFDWSHLRYWQAYLVFQRKLIKVMPHLSPYLILFFSVAPLLIVVVLINYIIQGWFYGFIKLLFEIIILLYCLGPRNLWADAFACINALTQGDANFAEEKLRASFGITDIQHRQSVHQQLVSKIFIEGNCRVFAVLFWFIILGPMGALLYRSILLTSTDSLKDQEIAELSQSASLTEALLDWLPVRLFAFLFALGGHFVQVFACFRNKTWLFLTRNHSLVAECGIASLGYHGNLPVDGSAERHAISLLDRTFIIMLAIIAMMAWLI